MGTFMEYFNAFWVGGLICALCQILLDRTKMLPGRIMVTLVCTGAVLSFLGLYNPFAEYAGAGASVPLLGFGHLLFQGVKDAVKESGFLGLFQGGLKAGIGYDYDAAMEKCRRKKQNRSGRTNTEKAGVLRKKHQNTRDRKKGSLQ